MEPRSECRHGAQYVFASRSVTDTAYINSTRITPQGCDNIVLDLEVSRVSLAARLPTRLNSVGQCKKRTVFMALVKRRIAALFTAAKVSTHEK